MADLPFIDRVRNPQNYPNPTKFDKEGRPQTHLLSADIDDKTGDWVVYPKLVVKDGKYVEQSMRDAINSGDSINFGKDQDSAIEFSKTYKDKINPDFEKYYEEFRMKKQTGDEVSYLQSALDMLAESAPVTEAPPGTFDLGTIEPFNPIMDRYKPNPLDEFAMMMADPTKKLKVISTPVKMQLKPLFAKRNKFKQLIGKQKFNYERGQDLASKADPRDIEQGNYMMNAAIKSGKRFQQQLNDIEEKIRKIYQSK